MSEPITIEIDEAGAVKSVDWEAWILTEIDAPACTRDDVAKTYSYLLQRRATGKESNWRKVNEAILLRWSPAGLQYIKTRAWRLAA